MSKSHPTFTRRRLIALLAGSAAALLGQRTGLVFGNIRFRNGRPATGLTISLGRAFNYTDVDGNYRIPNVPFGQYTLEVRQGAKILKRAPVAVGAAQIRHDEII